MPELMDKTSTIDPTTFNEACHRVATQIAYTVISKQYDYGQNNILVFGDKGLVVRLWDKISRLKNLIWSRNGIARHEPIQDTFTDIAGYAIIGLMLEKKWFTLSLKED